MDYISELDQLTRTTRKREFDDGLIDFVFGGTYLVICLGSWMLFSPTGLMWFARVLVQYRELAVIGLLGLAALFILVIFGARKVVDRIRMATIWRDRGVVQSLRWQVNRQTHLLAVGAAIIMIAAAYWMMTRGVIDPDAVLRTLVSAVGVATGVVYLGVGSELKLLRYKWVGVAGAMLSAAIIVLPVTFHVSWLLVGVVWIIVLWLSGLWALRKTTLAHREGNNE